METGQTCRSIRSIPGLENHEELATNVVRWAEGCSEPLLLPGLLSRWPALTLWKGPAGFDRLRKLAGEAEVQVMMSSSRVFFGDISRHQPAAIRFGQLLDLLESMSPPPPSTAPEPSLSDPALRREATVAADAVTAIGGVQGGCDAVELQTREGGGCLSISNGGAKSSSSRSTGTSTSSEESSHGQSGTSASSSRSLNRSYSAFPSGGGANGAYLSRPDRLHVYLAQQSLSGGLVALQGDLPLPACLLGKGIAASNLWMCGGSVRSSLHYDPHHNLLALVSGRKVVTVIPPYLTHCMYPMSIAGDAPNHSQVPFADTQPAARHPAYLAAVAAAAVVELRAGDALFLPEGWWHQVDSGPETTIAVNYWWRSALTELLTAPPPPPLSTLLVSQPDTHGVQQPPSLFAQSKATQVLVASETTEGVDAEEGEAEALPQKRAAHAAFSARSAGPGLRNLFTLRQLARAAIEDVVEALLAAVAPSAAASGVAFQDEPLSSSKGAYETGFTDATSTAVRHLSNAIRAVGAAGGTDSADSSPMLLTPSLPPHVAGILLHLPSGEAASLGFTCCPIAAALAALTPHQLAKALYCMCRTTPDLVSELLTRCCRVPVVACLLTRSFDQLGTLPAAPECTATAAIAAEAIAVEAASERALSAFTTSLGTGTGDNPEAVGVLARRSPGGDDGSVAAVAQTSAIGALVGPVAGRTSAAYVAENGSGHGVLNGLQRGLRKEGSEHMEGGAHQRPWKRRRYGGGDGQGGEGCSAVEEPTLSTLNRSSGYGIAFGKDHRIERGGRIDSGCNGANATAVGAGADCGPDAEVGAEDSGGSAVASNFFQTLYGTVADPDEVFRLLLEGRAALSSTARRILMEFVLS